jgi:hypothetical protein
MRGVFTVENEKSIGTGGSLEEALGKTLFVTEVHCAFNVAAIVLILETTVDDDLVVIAVVVRTIKNFHQRGMTDARQTFWFRRREVRKLKGRSIIDIHHRLKATGLVVVLFLFGIHHVTRVLEHAQRATELAGSARRRAYWLANGGKRRAVSTRVEARVKIEGLGF